MDERFVTLASLVANVDARATATPSIEPVATVRVARPMLDLARADIAQELALLRVAALEAFERASADLLARLAHDVLARELMLAPVDLAAFAARALGAFAELEPVGLVVAHADVAAFETSLPVRADASLEAGDLIVDVRDGAFESRFALRVRDTVRAVASAAAG